MKTDRREHKIISLLESRGEMTVNDLSRVLDVSLSTLRKQLAVMQSKGLVIRTYGGVMPVNRVPDETFESKLHKNMSEKRRIAVKARTMINSVETISLGSGTTVFELSNLLADIPICEEKFIVKDSDIRTDIDFTADKTKVDVELCATIRLAQVMHMLFAIAFGALGVLIQNKRRLRREKKQGIASDGIEVDVALEKDTDEAETSQINKDNNTEQNTQAEERTDSNGQ